MTIYAPDTDVSDEETVDEASRSVVRLLVCERAIGADDDARRTDAAALLAMLGLLDSSDQPQPRPRGAARRIESCAVNTSRARAHIAWLRGQGMLLREIAKDAKLTPRTLTELCRKETARPSTVERILAVVPRADGPPILTCTQCGTQWSTRLAVTRCKPCRSGQVPVSAAREHIQRLRAAKMPTRAIAARAQISKTTLAVVGNPARARASTHIAADTEARILAIPIPTAESQ